MRKYGKRLTKDLLHKMSSVLSLFALSDSKVQIMQIMHIPYSDFLHYLFSDERCEQTKCFSNGFFALSIQLLMLQLWQKNICA